MPSTLGEAIATEPFWLQSWVVLLGIANLAAVAFIAGRVSGHWRVRPEALVIVASFVAAAVFMDWLYGQVGYVRLLGLAHLVCWTPAYVWILARRRAIAGGSLFSKYIHAYLIIAGTSLVIDAVDVIRYLLGDGQLV